MDLLWQRPVLRYGQSSLRLVQHLMGRIANRFRRNDDRQTEMAAFPEIEITDSNEAIEFRTIFRSDDVGNPSLGFHPTFTGQLFDDELIRGYINLRVEILISACTLTTHISVKYLRLANTEEPPVDIVERLQKWLIIDYKDDLPPFLHQVSLEHLYMPMGECISKFTITQRNVRRNFEVYLISMEDPGFTSYHERIEGLLVMFIENITKIRCKNSWSCVHMYEVVQEGDKVWRKFAGVSTIFIFYIYPASCRPRISQFLILPPYQRLGLGKRLLATIYELFEKDGSVRCISVESPCPAFQAMRDFVDLQRALRLPCCSRDSVKDGYNKNFIDILTQTLLLPIPRVRRIYELARYFWIVLEDASDKSIFESEVKRRIRVKLNRLKNISRSRASIQVPVASSSADKTISLPSLSDVYAELISQYEEVVQKVISTMRSTTYLMCYNSSATPEARRPTASVSPTHSKSLKKRVNVRSRHSFKQPELYVSWIESDCDLVINEEVIQDNPPAALELVAQKPDESYTMIDVDNPVVNAEDPPDPPDDSNAGVRASSEVIPQTKAVQSRCLTPYSVTQSSDDMNEVATPVPHTMNMRFTDWLLRPFQRAFTRSWLQKKNKSIRNLKVETRPFKGGISMSKMTRLEKQTRNLDLARIQDGSAYGSRAFFSRYKQKMITIHPPPRPTTSVRPTSNAHRRRFDREPAPMPHPRSTPLSSLTIGTQTLSASMLKLPPECATNTDRLWSTSRLTPSNLSTCSASTNLPRSSLRTRVSDLDTPGTPRRRRKLVPKKKPARPLGASRSLRDAGVVAEPQPSTSHAATASHVSSTDTDVPSRLNLRPPPYAISSAASFRTQLKKRRSNTAGFYSQVLWFHPDDVFNRVSSSNSDLSQDDSQLE